MLSTNLGKIKLRNPLVLASGILGTEETILKRISRQNIGAVTTKSIGPKERLGNRNPSVVEWEHGFLNAVGLPSPGIEEADKELTALGNIKKPFIASCYGHSIEEFAEIAKKLTIYKPSMIELDASCPNVANGMCFSSDKELAFRLVKKVKSRIKKSSIPIQLWALRTFSYRQATLSHVNCFIVVCLACKFPNERNLKRVDHLLQLKKV